MKKRIYAMMLAAVMAFGVSACGSSDTQPQVTDHAAVLTMGTGDADGSYYAFGNLLAAHMGDAAGVNVEVVSTTNVIFSFKSMSDSIVFNKNCSSLFKTK